MTIDSGTVAEAMAELRAENEAYRALAICLLTPIAAAVNERGEPAYEPKAAVARAVAMADALNARLLTKERAAVRKLLAELEAEEDDT